MCNALAMSAMSTDVYARRPGIYAQPLPKPWTTTAPLDFVHKSPRLALRVAYLHMSEALIDSVYA